MRRGFYSVLVLIALAPFMLLVSSGSLGAEDPFDYFHNSWKAIGPYLTHQGPDGRFESQKGQFDANGQAQWILWQYHKMTGDRAWLENLPGSRRTRKSR